VKIRLEDLEDFVEEEEVLENDWKEEIKNKQMILRKKTFKQGRDVNVRF
jgi:hypothetical protein